MEVLADLIKSGQVTGILIAVMVTEAAVLIAYRLGKGRGFAVPYIISNLLAGLFLVLALRAALTGAAWPWIAASLAAAGIAHVADLVVRWPST